MKTYVAKAGEIERKWYVVDAEGKTLGRLASEVAKVLRGKNKPTFTPHVACGDNVIIINAEKDMVLRGGMKEQVLDAFPSAELYEVAGAGHICLEDRAEEMAEITYNFLNK